MATSAKSAKPAAKGAEAAEAPKKSKKMLLIVILLGVLLLIVAGGAAAFFVLSSKKPAEAEHAASSGESSKVPVFVAIEPYVVNLQTAENGSDQFLQTSLTLQVADEGTAEAIKTFMPLVRSRLLVTLSSKKSAELVTVEGKKKLTEEIIATLNQPFTPNGKPQQVNDVFYTSFVIQQQ
ncbi:flagellar basal body-associated protein FliL [Oxalobacteraceae bacterium CAVE-383]|nr:flagellar basal body-associated protein FliL [Oxalobacteraceae bacterium CAVE-383]